MTLKTVPEYDPTRLGDIGAHAVVVGGSMAGLLAARVLADGFTTVTLIERDVFPEEPVARRGVPQGRHIHLMLESGRTTIEELFPGYTDELLAEGGLKIDAMADFLHYEQGGYLAEHPNALSTYCASRPLFEHVVRRQITDRDAIQIRDECQCLDYLVDTAAGAVTGVQIQSESGQEELAADLVVDATGRTSRTPRLLDDHGFESPPVDEVHVDVAYSTAVVERPPDDRRLFFVPPAPDRPRGAGVFPAEDGRWLTTFFGLHGDHPPTEIDDLRDFAASLPGPDFAGLLTDQASLSDEIAQYPFPSNRRNRYEALDRFPTGLVVIGDAIASFNPIYGQGMAVAALEALILHDTLKTAETSNLATTFFDRVEQPVNQAWSIAIGGDFAFPQTTGPKPRGTDFINRYLDRFVRKAQTDPELRKALYHVFNLKKPTSSLLHPRILWRVLQPDWPGTTTPKRRITPTRWIDTESHK